MKILLAIPPELRAEPVLDPTTKLLVGVRIEPWFLTSKGKSQFAKIIPEFPKEMNRNDQYMLLISGASGGVTLVPTNKNATPEFLKPAPAADDESDDPAEDKD